MSEHDQTRGVVTDRSSIRKARGLEPGVAIREGNFADFYRDEVHRVVGFLMKLGASEQEAVESTQAAFVWAWVSRRSIRTNRRAWVRTVATREFYRSMPQREITTAAVPDLPTPLSPETTVEISERTKVVHDMLMSLPLSQRIAMAWTADGFSVTEIAKATSTTPAAVRKNLQRARAAMKLLLARRNDEGGAR